MSAAQTPTLPARTSAHSPPRVRVRWKIFLYLFGFGFVAYLQQRGLTVASYDMMPNLHLSQMQIGWLLQAMLLGYTALQFPGGVIGQRVGARWMFVIISLIAFAATLGTPLAPLFLGGTALFAALLSAQLLLGSSQGPIFPVSAGVFEAWFPSRQWPLVQGLQSMGLQLGAALTPPLIASLMVSFGWQRALAWSTLPVLALIGGWAWYGRDTPEEHPRVSAAELAELDPQGAARVDQAISWRGAWQLMRNRDVLALTVSYVCMNYVFYLLANWSFLYLVQERHFTRLEGGWLASTPPLAAAIGAGVGGQLASMLGERYGVRIGLRIIPLLSLPAAGVLQFAAVDAANAYLAVVALALCFAAVEMNEGPYWAAIMHVGRADAMAASGLLNTGGNLGGLICTPIVAYLSGHDAWTLAFLIGTVFAAVSAALWLLVDPTRTVHLEAASERALAASG
ncbi:MAG TPA: MFS transporter [Steroidobacteraceae bacterium]|nr:MFS transporter [Steroidobacteraceae bacterium]